MIWYYQELQSIGQPNQTTISLNGVYNEPGSGSHLITIQIEIIHDGKSIIKKIFENTPSMFNLVEEPNADDIYMKYRHKIVKIRDKVMKTPFDSILEW